MMFLSVFISKQSVNLLHKSTSILVNFKLRCLSNRRQDINKHLLFKKVVKNDFGAVIQHLRCSYFKDEPLLKMAKVQQGGKPNLEMEEFVKMQMEEGLSIMAVDDRDSQIGGVVICTKESQDTAKRYHFMDQRIEKMYDFCRALAEGAELAKKYRTHNWLVIQTVSVAKEFRGLGLATKLSKRTKKLAQDNCTAGIRVECTAVETQKLFQNLGFDTVKELAYRDFPTPKDPYFTPEAPHWTAKLMASRV